MSDTHLADDLTEAERHFFDSRGDVNEALVGENKDTPPPAGGEGASPAPVAPPAVAAQPEGDTGADDDDEVVEQVAQPGQPQEGQPGKKPPRQVNYNKFRREEERRVAAEKQLEETKITGARVEERLKLLMEALNGPTPEQQQQAQEEQDPRPDKNTDIFAYADWLERQVVRTNQRLDGYDQMVQTGQSEMTQQNSYFEDMNNFAGRERNFVAAYAHLFRSRDAELAAYHPTLTAQQRNQIIIEEERSLYKQAFQEGRSPAETIYRLAQIRGFQPPAAQPAAQRPAGQPGNGQAAPARGPAGTPLGQPAAAAQPGAPAQPGSTQQIPQPKTAAELVDAIRRGQGAAMSLSQGGGGTGIELTPQMLGDMDDDAFEVLYEEIKSRGKNREREVFGF